ncbi:MAG: hypothetical protein FIA92_11325 [Chloroflexi bacterium]|nr:hypothetical protein [Chloroflexota bacterium]
MTWRSTSSVDETLAQLDALHRPLAERRAAARVDLDRMVAALSVSSEPWAEAADAERPTPSARRRAGTVAQGREPDQFVALPERTTHGGPFGPAVRAKLIAEALANR